MFVFCLTNICSVLYSRNEQVFAHSVLAAAYYGEETKKETNMKKLLSEHPVQTVTELLVIVLTVIMVLGIR